MATTTAPESARAPDTYRRALRRLQGDSAYVLTGFPLALAVFVASIVSFAFGVGLFPIVVGLPILTATLLLARGFAATERGRIAAVLGTGSATPRYLVAKAGAGWWRQKITPLLDAQSWLDLAHCVVRLVLASATFAVVFSWWAVTIAGALYPIYDWAIPRPPDSAQLHELLGMPDTAPVRILFNVGLGAIFALTLPVVVRGCALGQAKVAYKMLIGLTQLRTRIMDLEDENATVRSQKAAAVSAEAIALRRLERDIHDGPQQRLVRLAMDLGRAQHQFDSDPAAARATVTEALSQTRETLDELRALSRGIAPPILVDRGLTAALAALAGRSTVPVDLATADLGRLDPAVENTAYFVVAESLTNVAKHSDATECRVELRRVGDRLTVVICDDGVGGAHLAKGHGLTGLADRVHAAGGRLTVASPVGAGTTVTAEVPVSERVGAPAEAPHERANLEAR